MAIIRVTKEQLEEAWKARQVALKGNPNFRKFVQQQEELRNAVLKEREARRKETLEEQSMERKDIA